MRKRDVDKLTRVAKGADSLKSVKLIGEPWHDDHVVCTKAEINGIRVELWWIGEDGYAALKYAHDSETARKDVLNVLRTQIENDLLDVESGNDAE